MYFTSNKFCYQYWPQTLARVIIYLIFFTFNNQHYRELILSSSIPIHLIFTFMGGLIAPHEHILLLK